MGHIRNGRKMLFRKAGRGHPHSVRLQAKVHSLFLDELTLPLLRFYISHESLHCFLRWAMRAMPHFLKTCNFGHG